MGRAKTGGLAVAAGLVLSLSLVACTGSGGDEVSEGTGSRPAPSISMPSKCVAADDLVSAQDGPISAGPFAGQQEYWLQPQGTKLWVASSVNQEPTSATIRAQRIDTTDPPVVVHRGPDTIAVPTDDPPGLFFPGLFRLPARGTWSIDVTIGSDSGCFLVHV